MVKPEFLGTALNPKVDHWNMRFGAKHPRTTRVIYTNGGEDPWRHAAITPDVAMSEENLIIDIEWWPRQAAPPAGWKANVSTDEGLPEQTRLLSVQECRILKEEAVVAQ